MKFMKLFVLSLLMCFQMNSYGIEQVSEHILDLNYSMAKEALLTCPQTCQEANCGAGTVCKRAFSWSCGAYYYCAVKMPASNHKPLP